MVLLRIKCSHILEQTSHRMFRYGKEELGIQQALRIARGTERAVLTTATRRRIHESAATVATIARGEAAVYGINTGFGPLCHTIISPDQTRELQRNILLSHSVGVGEALSPELTRLMLLLKVHALAQGYSGIAPEVLDRILWHLEQDVLPIVPEQGSVGASGDLAPLSHLFLPLIGEGKVRYRNQVLPTAQVLQQFQLPPLQLGPKAGLALINGTQFIAAHAILVVDEMYNCLAHADLNAALMIEGLRGSAAPFDERLHQTRPHPGNQHVAQNVRRLLGQSQIMKAHENCQKVQDPYSLRCVPQVHGASRQAWLQLKNAVAIEINSVTDNPVVFDQGLTISGGNFHGQPLALPLDYACLGASEIGNISDRRAYLSLEGRTEEVPKLLLRNTGVHSGFMLLQYTAAALASENKGLCFPASADSIPTSLGQEDHVSMGSIGGRKALRVCRNVLHILAIELLCATQALDFQRPLKTSRLLEKAHRQIRAAIPFAEKARIFAEDIQKARALIQSRILLPPPPRRRSDRGAHYHSFEVY